MLPIDHNQEMQCIFVDDGKGLKGKTPLLDYRANKLIGMHDQQVDQTAFFQRLITAKVDNTEISIAAPNEIAIALHISEKAVEKSDELRLLIKNKSKQTNPAIYQKDVTIAYDYIEEIQKAVVFSYKAVESFCNAVIPEDYIYIKTNTKGVEERYKKEQIERLLNTSEKVSKILPEIMNVTSPSQENFWSGFKELERLRHEIIHSKSSSNTKVLIELFLPKMRDYINSSSEILHFFIKADPYNIVFPMRIGGSKIGVRSCESITALIKEVPKK